MVFIALFLNRRTKKREKIILMPWIFADYGRRFSIGNIPFLEGYVESLPGLLNTNRLSLSYLEHSQTTFKVAKLRKMWNFKNGIC